MNLLAIKAGIALAIILLLFGWHVSAEHKAVKAATDAMQIQWDEDRAQTAQAAIAAAAQNAAETTRRLAADKEAQDANELRIAQARNDAVGSAAALDRLRHSISATVASSGAVPSNSTTAGIIEGQEKIGDLLATCAAEYRSMAIDADEDRNSGIESNDEYDALSASTLPGLSEPVPLSVTPTQ